MSFDTEIFDHLKRSMGFVSDAQLMSWLGISKDSLSGIRTGRLAMGESIRFTLLEKWWTHLRAQSPDLSVRASLPPPDTDRLGQISSAFSAAVLYKAVAERLSTQEQAIRSADRPFEPQKQSADAALLEAFKLYKKCPTDTDLAAVLGVKRHSISMVRSGKNGLGPRPLLKIYEDVFQAQHLGLQSVVQSSQALLKLFLQGSA